ncbi:O-antigen ligase domain-containing protein [Marinilabiliaceae bacterium JC017]|nr:O-antigen ligase domain-containing protein [Marinilabiliaceae bacterium JC017]
MRGLRRIAIYLFFFSINFEMWDPFNTDGYFSIAKLVGLVYLLIMLPSIIQFNTPKVFKQVLGPVLFFFGILTVVSVVNVKVGYYGFFDVSIFLNIIFLWILINHEKMDELVLEKSMLSFAIGNVVLSILFFLGIGVEYDFVESRSSIFGDNPNSVGIHMSISLVILIVALIQNRLKIGMVRFAFIPGMIIIFYAMISTGSRVSFIAFFLFLVSFIALFKTRIKWGKPVLMVISILLAIYTWQFYLKTEGITQRLIMALQDGDLSNRVEIWKRIYPIWLENPILGIGRTGYEYVVFSFSNKFLSPHNVILEILCLTGVIGMFFYFIFFFRLFRISYLFYREYSYLLPILLFIPVLGMLLSAQILKVKIGWVIYSYVLANSLYLSKSRKSLKLET